MSPVVSSYGSGGSFAGGFRFTVEIEQSALATLPQRMDETLEAALIFHLADAAQRVVDRTRHYLVRLEEPAVKNQIHGYDTGLMYVSLKYALMGHMLDTGVFYELLSDEAKYWRWVEFGHWTRSGNFWPGYHMLETAIEENAGYIRQRVREAWHDTVIKLAAEASVPGVTGQLGIG